LEFLSESPNFSNLVIYVYLYSAASFNYYLINFYLKYLPGNIYQNMMVASIAECIASFSSIYIIRSLGPTVAFAASFGMCAAASGCLTIASYADYHSLIPVIVMVAKLASTAAISMVYINTLHYFPSQYLGRVFGICGSIGKFVTIFAPMVAETPEPTASVTMMLSCSLATFLSIWLSSDRY